MAKKAKKKVRTTAQRRAAALASWELRRLQVASKPTSTKKGHVTPTIPGINYSAFPSLTPTTAAATKEGDELYVTISAAGGVSRHLLSRDTMRKLGLDCLQLVG